MTLGNIKLAALMKIARPQAGMQYTDAGGRPHTYDGPSEVPGLLAPLSNLLPSVKQRAMPAAPAPVDSRGRPVDMRPVKVPGIESRMLPDFRERRGPAPAAPARPTPSAPRQAAPAAPAESARAVAAIPPAASSANSIEIANLARQIARRAGNRPVGRGDFSDGGRADEFIRNNPRFSALAMKQLGL